MYQREVKMDKEQAIAILKYFQYWRKGGEVEQPDPKEISKAIEFAIKELEK